MSLYLFKQNKNPRFSCKMKLGHPLKHQMNGKEEDFIMLVLNVKL